MAWELLVKQPPMLEDLAISTLIKWYTSPVRKCLYPKWSKRQIRTEVENIISSKTEMDRKYFRAIPNKFHDKLIAETVRQLSTITKDLEDVIESRQRGPRCGTYLMKLRKQLKEQPHKKAEEETYLRNLVIELKLVGQMIETFFSEKVTFLALDNHHMTSFEYTFCKFHLLPNLKSLTINCSRCPGEKKEKIKTHILQILKESQNLKYLKLGMPVEIGDEILTCIVDNCKLIEELDFRTSKINDNSVHLLAQMPLLKTFHIDRAMSIDCFKTVMLSCEHVENIRLAASLSFDVLKAVQEITFTIDHSDKLIKLKSYTGVNNTSEQMLILANMCPSIDRLILYGGRNEHIDFRALAGFNYLSQLHLEDYSFYGNHVKEALDEFGHNLRSLSFVRDEHFDLNALIHISQKCSNLESLIFSNCIFEKYVPEYDANKLAIRPFINLKTFCLFKGAFVQQDENLINEVVNLILSNSLNVEFVKIGYPSIISAFNDVDVRTLRCLKDLEIKVYDRIPYREMWNNHCIQ